MYGRVRGRFAGEVASIEFLEGSVDVVGVERTDAAIRSSASISPTPSTSA